MEKIICKSCGAPNEVEALSGDWFCEYCGNPIELGPDRAKFKDLFSKADDAWDRKDFDDALKLYEQIVAQDNTQAEAHWSAAMCRYGVAFVVDPLRGSKMPTCNRINRTSILEDKNYLAAIRHASPKAKASYEKLAREIDRISARFLKIVDQEAPYDVFISYKKTGENGRATLDSDYARNLYYFLTEKGLKVFFAEESLMDVAGHMYEPYIFAALTSAKVMVLMGSRREHFEAVWVKNEWKRFLLLAEKDLSKSLVPVCIKCRPEEALPMGLTQMQALDGDDFNFRERIYDIIKRKMGAAPQAKKAGNMNLLAEKYATKENVAKVCDALDCEPDLAAEVLILKQGKVNETISYISSDKTYQKSLWICTECGAKNTHDVCHNPKCGISHADSIKLKQMREEAARREAEQKRIAEEERRREYERSEEAKRIRKAKRAAARKRFFKTVAVIVFLLAAAAGVVAYLNPIQEIRVTLPAEGVSVFYCDTLDGANIKVEGKFLLGDWKEIDHSELSVTGFDSSTLGEKEITFTYKGKTATAVVEVLPFDLSQPVLSVKKGAIFAKFDDKFVDKLVLEVNGQEHILEGRELSGGQISFLLNEDYAAGEYAVRAKAISNDPCVNDSAYSQNLTATKLAPVEILERNGSILTFAQSEETSKYEIYIDGVYLKTVTEATFDLMDVDRAGNHTVSVAVCGTDGDNTVSSVQSEAWEYAVLSNAINISVADGQLNWSSVEGAVGYEVYANGALYATFDADTTSLSVMRFYDQSGSASIAIRAVGDGETFLTSPKSEAFVQNYDEVYIPIRTVEDLYKLANSEEKYLLTNDIDLAGIAWTPIEGFKGTLVGNGCAIRNLTINADYGNVGFFATLKGTVTDLVFENASITVTGRNENVGILCGTLTGNATSVITAGTVTAETCTNVGGIAGLVDRGGTYEITDLENQANVTGSEKVGGVFGSVVNQMSNYSDFTMSLSELNNSGNITGSGNYVGGIAGYLTAESNYSITLCSADLTNTGAINGKQHVGGIFGYGYCDSANSYLQDSSNASAITAEAYVGAIAGQLSNIAVNNCQNTGSTLTATGYATADGIKYAYVGGFVGRGYLANNCTNDVEIKYSGGGRYVGGIIGYVGAPGTYTMSDLENTANISGADYVGGVFGGVVNQMSNYSDFTINLSQLKNSGDITGSGNYVGGIAGYLTAESNYSITLCGADLTNTGAIKGKQYVGGLIGYGYCDSTNSYLQDSSNASAITAEAYVGAIAGQLSNIAVNNCQNTGSTLTATGYATADGIKYAYVGGFVGRGYLANNCTNDVEIKYSGGGRYVGGIIGYVGALGTYAMGDLENTANISGAEYVGGIFGSVENRTSNYSDFAVDLSRLKNSGNITGSGNYVGGIVGYLKAESNNSVTLYGANLSNTGTIKGKMYVGGLFGYGYCDGTNSYLQDSSNASSVTAEAYVGTIAGELYNIAINNCQNTGSKLTATGYATDDGIKYAYVGGFVGRGYLANNCTNDVEIKYSGGGRYVGGIFGYVGTVGTYTMNDLKNTANISGAEYVGGIFGGIVNQSSNYSDFAVNLSELENTGSIFGSGNYVGGIAGYLAAGSNYSVTLYGTNLTNTGAIKGKLYVGGLFGYVKTDSTNSSVVEVVATGTVTATNNYGKRYGFAENVKFE